MRAFQETLHALSEKLLISRFQGFQGKQRQVRRASPKEESGPLAREVALVSHLLRKAWPADRAVLIPKGRADTVAVDQIVAAPDDPLAIVCRRIRKVKPRPQAVLIRRKHVGIRVGRCFKIVDRHRVGRVRVLPAEVQICEIVTALPEPAKNVITKSDVQRELAVYAPII